MVSLWGTKKGNEDSEPDAATPNSGEGSEQPSTTHHREPTERTRLLSPRRGGYLDPDDPAVTPYNLWSVRALRYFSVLFLGISFVWWVLLLVSIFISPPGMHSRGSGFFDFSYTTLTVGNLMIALLFFATPSKGQRIMALSISVILLVDMIMILAISRIRAEEGWVGIVSVVWATLIAVWTIVTDRVVAWGKREEEERLTGREESRRTLAEWLSVLVSGILMVLLIVVSVLLTATLIIRARDASLPAPGEKYFVDGAKYEVHVFCEGPTHDSNGTRNPTVFFEGGEDPVEGSLAPFAENALKNGTISRYCYWDRPGLAWSDNAPSPMSAGMAADALSEALARAGEEGPWVLVSAGVGGIYSRVFASRHVKDVQGFLLIDTLHEDLLHRIGSPGKGFLLWAYGIISPLGLDRIAGAILKGRTREDRVYGRSAYQGGKYIKAKLQENLVANSLTKNEVVSARRIQSNETPVVVVSSGIECKKDSEWERKQEDLTKITNNLVTWDVVNKAPHEVWQTYDGRQLIEKRLSELV